MSFIIVLVKLISNIINVFSNCLDKAVEFQSRNDETSERDVKIYEEEWGQFVNIDS